MKTALLVGHRRDRRAKVLSPEATTLGTITVSDDGRTIRFEGIEPWSQYSGELTQNSLGLQTRAVGGEKNFSTHSVSGTTRVSFTENETGEYTNFELTDESAGTYHSLWIP